MWELLDKSVYLAAPKRLLNSDLYSRAAKFIIEQNPIGLLNAHGLFESNGQWFKHYEDYLTACNVMVVVSDNAIVGKGVYTEYHFFKDRDDKIYHYIETGKTKTLIEIKKLHILDADNWIDYAVIKYN
jgi:hypothetical protein